MEKEELCGCWIKCERCGSCHAFEFSTYKKYGGKLGCFRCKCVDNCPKCKIFKFKDGKMWKIEGGEIVGEIGEVYQKGEKFYWKEPTGEKNTFWEMEIEPSEEGIEKCHYCKEHCEDEKTRKKEIIKPTIEEIKEFYERASRKKNNEPNLLKKAYYLSDDYLVIEYSKKELATDIFTTNSEGLFLGYEGISESTPLLEAIEIAKNQIYRTLNKLNVKVKQLSEEFWNWATEIVKLEDSKKVNNFLNKMLRASEQQYIKQQQPVSSSNKDKFPYWIFIPVSLLLVIGLVWGMIIYRKRKRKLK